MVQKWWHDKVAYQIYPKSFCDSNGDGIGDLRGIIGKLDYLKGLGVDIIWLSPIYCSPLADQGYDVSDYYNIDPRFGTMADMDELLAEAKKRGMYVLMDLVVNHCSDEHEWFKAACQEPDGKYGKYFYIEDWHEGDPLPSNWRSYFGGSCWDKLPGHENKVYLHVFHKKQPDLNWENPEVRQDIYKMMRWWLDKGLAGFRVDAIINIKKKLPYENYPADRADGLCSINRMLERAQGITDFLDEMADVTFRRYDAFSVGEVFNEKDDELPLFIGDNGCFSSMFDFAAATLNASEKGWYDVAPVTAEQYKAAVFKGQKRAYGIGLMSNIIENHDEPRSVSHYIPEGECTPAAKKMLGGLSLLLRGIPFIYQGQEIGMENYHYDTVDEVDDISAKAEYQVAFDAGLSEEEALMVIDHFSRDNGRSPFQWDGTEGAGFTSGTPWLRINPNHREINLARQMDDPGSVYNWYRSLTALRHNPEYASTLVYGETVPYLPEQRNLMAYYRKGEKILLVLANFQRGAQKAPLPGQPQKVLLNNLPDFTVQDGCLLMDGYQFVLLLL